MTGEQTQPQPAPAAVSSLPGLSDLPEEMLKDLADGDPAALRRFCRGLKNPTQERYDRDARETREAVTELIKDNEAVLEETERSREALIVAVGEANGLRDEVDGLRGRVGERAAALDPAELCRQLRDVTVEAEEGSDAVAEAFLSGDVPHDEFLKTYLELRTRHHKKKVKLEQLRKMTSWRQ